MVLQGIQGPTTVVGTVVRSHDVGIHCIGLHEVELKVWRSIVRDPIQQRFRVVEIHP